MEFWEFLLQKEGDRSWLPLESPDVEILEGRYRVVARTSRPNTSVEIRITHVATDELPAKRRIQTRSHQTNKDGLMIIFPFTRLKPGRWELRCSADVMANFMGENWQHAVRLQVSPEQAEEALEWEPDWQAEIPEDREEVSSSVGGQSSSPTEEPPVSEAVPPIAADASPVVAFPIAELPVSPTLAAIPAEVTGGSGDAVEENPAVVAFDPTLFRGPVLLIHLERETWMAPWGDSFLLTGQVQVQDEAPGLQEITPLILELQVYLRDPQSLQVLVEACQPMTLQSANTPWTCSISIPSNCGPRLLLGEVCLYRREGDSGAELTPLASQSFTVTAVLGELLNTLNRVKQGGDALSDDQGDPVQAGDPPEPARPSLDLTSLKLIDAPKAQPAFKPVGKQALPPRLGATAPEKAPSRSIQLPNLRKQQPQSVSPDPDPADPGEVLLEIEPERSEPSALGALEDSPIPLTEGNWETAPPSESQTLIGFVEEPAKASTLGSLNFQTRFFNRLTALATDDELSALLRADLPKPLVLDAQGELVTADAGLMETVRAGDPVDDPLTTVPVEEMVPLPDDPEEHWASHEIVVEDDPPEPESQSQQDMVAATIVLEESEPVPIPELEVPSGELVSGQVIHVRIRLPMTPYRLFVKFWMTDRQTFSLIEEPRTLMTLTPNGFGDLESTLVLTVPYGSLEISLEAIAVELHSRRESHKAIAYRLVVPPDLPLLPLEDLET